MRKIFIIEGLDCPNCAKLVENHLNSIEEIEKATIDFIGGKLFITFKKELSIEKLEKLIAEVEDGISLKDKDDKEKKIKKNKISFSDFEVVILRLVFSSIILAFAYFWNLSNTLRLILYITSYLIAGYDVLVKMIKGLLKKEIFTEFTLMCVATIGALILGEYLEAVAIMILYQIGELLQDAAVDKSRKMIKDTIDLRPQKATIIRKDGSLINVEASSLKVDDIIDIKVGEKIPADSLLINGEGTIDASSLTGESLPVKVDVNDELLSGTTLVSGHLTAKVIKEYKDSTASKILELIETNGEKKSKAEKFVTKFASIYTPVVFLFAFIVGIIIPLINGNWNDYVYKALVLLVTSCPCSIIISVPLAYYVGMGELAAKGVIVKGANYLDVLRGTKSIVTDKTGTLTKGKFTVIKVETKMDENEFISCVVHAESISNHPFAFSIINYFNIPIDHSLISEKEEISGLGVKVIYNGKKVVVGGSKLVKSATKIKINAASVIYVEIDDEYVGYIVLKDEIKDTSYQFIEEAHKHDYIVSMLTGDTKDYATEVANELKIDEIYAELLPAEKVQVLESILEDKEREKVIYIGDGINDAPSLARADVGIAMGAIGSDSAIETADVVIMSDNLMNVITAIDVSKKTYHTSIFNIIFSLGFKLMVYILTLLNYSSMWIALVADVGVTLLLILNSLRLKKRIRKKLF